MKFLTLCSVLLLSRLVMAQSPEIPTYRIGEVGASHKSLPATGYWNPVVCDSDGNMYLQVDAGSTKFERTPIWKISPDAEKVADFALPNELAGKINVASFYGLPDGFYEIAYDQSGVYLLQFEGNGAFSAKTTLETPKDFRPDAFAPFLSGNFLLVGHIQSTGSPGSGRSYAAVFSGNGKIAREIPTSNKAEDVSHLSKFAATGTDGNVYNLSGDQVQVISASGKVIRSFPVPGPEGYRPNNIHISGGLVSIQFSKTDSNHHVSFEFETYELGTGIPRARYIPDGVPSTPLCFSSNEGYTFFRNNGGQFEIVRAWTH